MLHATCNMYVFTLVTHLIVLQLFCCLSNYVIFLHVVNRSFSNQLNVDFSYLGKISFEQRHYHPPFNVRLYPDMDKIY